METAPLFLCVFVLSLVLSGLALRLPSILVLAGGCLLGAALGQLLGVYDFVLLGDLASLAGSVLDNGSLIAIPMLMLSGGLLSGTRAFAGFARRCRGRLSFLPALLLAMAGGDGSRHAHSALLQRAAPSSAFLVLVGDLLERLDVASAADGGAPMGGFVVGLMAMMALPAILLALGMSLFPSAEELDRDDHEQAQAPAPPWAEVLAVLTALAVPALVISKIATPIEAGAAGVGFSLLLKIPFKELNPGALSLALDNALRRSATLFAVLLAGLAFHLVFEGLGCLDVLQSLLPASLDRQTAFVAAIISTAILGCLIEPVALAVFVLPILGPYFLALGLGVFDLGAVIVLAPLTGLVLGASAGKFLWRAFVWRAFVQACALAAALFVSPLLFSADEASPPVHHEDSEDAPSDKSADEGFTPDEGGDSTDSDGNLNDDYAPPNESE